MYLVYGSIILSWVVLMSGFVAGTISMICYIREFVLRNHDRGVSR